MEKFNTNPTAKSDRIPRLVENLYRKMPEIEADRAVLLTESYRKTEGEPMVMRRAKAFAHILANIPIIIREEELVVGSSTLAPRGCQTFPEYSWEWLEAEFDTEIVIIGDDSLMNIDQYSIQRVAPEQNKTEDLLNAYAPSTDARRKNARHMDAKKTTMNAPRRKRKKGPTQKKTIWQKLVG